MSAAEDGSLLERMGARLQRFLGAPDSFRGKFMRGGTWLMSGFALVRLLDMGRGVIFMGILSADDFGPMAVVQSTMGLLLVLTTPGINAAIIQRKGEVESYLDTVWVIGLVRGLVLAVILSAVAPLVASFYERPLLVPLIRLSSLALVIQGLGSPGRLLRDRALEFRRPVMISAAGQAVAIALGILFVLIARDVYALVACNLVFAAQQTVCSYLVHPFRPRVRFERSKARELWRFGRGITISTILIWINTSGDRLLLGKLLGIPNLGHYDRASIWGNMPATNISHIFNRLLFPAFAKLQDKPDQLRRVYWRTMAFYAALSVPLGMAIIFGAEPILHLLGKNYAKWEPAMPALRIMAVYGMSRALAGVNGSVLLAKGRSGWTAWCAGLRLVIFLALVWPCVEAWGVTGAAAVATIGALGAHATGWVMCHWLMRSGR